MYDSVCVVRCDPRSLHHPLPLPLGTGRTPRGTDALGVGGEGGCCDHDNTTMRTVEAEGRAGQGRAFGPAQTPGDLVSLRHSHQQEHTVLGTGMSHPSVDGEGPL